MALPSFDEQVASMDSRLLDSKSGFGVELFYVDVDGQSQKLSVIPASEYDQTSMLSRADKAPAMRVKMGKHYELLTASVPRSIKGLVFDGGYECSDVFEINDSWSLMTLVPVRKQAGNTNGSFFRDEN